MRLMGLRTRSLINSGKLLVQGLSVCGSSSDVSITSGFVGAGGKLQSEASVKQHA
jgi:hypothetical protein